MAEISFLEERYAFEYLYPYPLADLYRRFRVARGEVDRLGYVLAAGEASVKFLTVLALSRFSKLDRSFTTLSVGLKRRIDHPGFGTWRSLLESLLSVAPDSPLPELEGALALCFSPIDGLSYFDSAKILVERRNEFVHGGVIGNDAATSLLSDVLPHLQRCYRAISFLKEFHFVYCEEVRRLRRPSCFEAVIRRCMGSNSVFPFETLRLEEPISPGVPLLLTPDLKHSINLYPLMAFFPSEKAGSPRCYFFYNRKQDTFWHTYELQANVFRSADSDDIAEFDLYLSGDASPLQSLRFEGIPPYWLLNKMPNVQDLPANYRMLGKIGEGRFGNVYKVAHVVLAEERALKRLRPEVANDPRIRKRFELEAQALARLRNRSVAVNIYEFGEDKDGVPYLVEQLCKDGSLDEAIRRWGPKAWLEVKEIALKCFRSLEVVHEYGIIHRDIKPSNILLDGDNFLFCDFGGGRLTDAQVSMTTTEDALGTLFFMAPEQYEGRHDKRSDIYSLGACLVALLAGETVSDLASWLTEKYCGNLEFRQSLLNMVELVPENRPPNAAAVIARLESIAVKELASAELLAITPDALEPIPATGPEPRVWRRADGVVFREINASWFMMGGTKYPDERPVHKVRFSNKFFLSTTLVTNRQFLEFCKVTGYRGVHNNFLLHVRRKFGRPWEHPDSPVVFVSWDDAREFLLWQSERDGLNYYLPSEAQWELVCRAGSRTVYWWGNEYREGMANVDNRHGHPTPVGAYPPNPWGFFDMLGNVWEWCEDTKDVIPREESLFYRKCAMGPGGICVDPLNTDPHALVSQRVPPGLKVLRGGSFTSEGRNFRPANRRGQHREDCVRSVGFRAAVEGVDESALQLL